MRPDIEAFSVCANTHCANGPSRQLTITDKQTKNPGTRTRAFFVMATPLSKYSGQVRDLTQASIIFFKLSLGQAPNKVQDCQHEAR
jgi:hypothetical protein